MNKRRQALIDLGLEDSIVFENPDFDSAIIGYDAVKHRVIYDFEKMIEHLMENDKMEYEDAIDFIEYNTLRAIPYMGENAPIVLHSIEDYLDYYSTEDDISEKTEIINSKEIAESDNIKKI